jgi:ppGpp synthetase/RelA/SpoT-type nucleotidyltranferase
MPDSSNSNAKPLFDATDFQRKFQDYQNVYQALLDEVIFILQDAISDKGIKIHGVECRIKSYDSIIKKCREKNYKDPFDDLVDISGA